MSVEVAIIGAGPYGLSLAAHLSRRGIQHRIIGETMRTWERHMPNGMFLKSEGCASSIDEPTRQWTLREFSAQAGMEYSDVGRPVPVETFRAYGRWFQEHLVPHVVEEEEVTAVSREGAGFSLELSSGVGVTARRVVVASGITEFAYLPPELGSLPPGRVSHTSEHTDFTAFGGRRVAVLGAGQSALETAALLRESGARPQLIARSRTVNWNPDPAVSGYYETSPWRLPPSPLGAGWRLWTYWSSIAGFPHLPHRFRARFVQHTLGPAGAWWLHPRFGDGVAVTLGQSVVGSHEDGDGIVLALASANGISHVRADHVIAGTGYRVNLDKLTFLSADLHQRLRLASGAPVLSPAFESSVPGLYFAGLAAADTFGPAMRFVCGTRFAGPRLARHLRAPGPASSLRRYITRRGRRGGLRAG